MIFELTLQKIDDSDGAFLPLPDEVLSRLDVVEGDSLVLTISDDGAVRINKATTASKQETSD